MSPRLYTAVVRDGKVLLTEVSTEAEPFARRLILDRRQIGLLAAALRKRCPWMGKGNARAHVLIASAEGNLTTLMEAVDTTPHRRYRRWRMGRTWRGFPKDPLYKRSRRRRSP